MTSTVDCGECLKILRRRYSCQLQRGHSGPHDLGSAILRNSRYTRRLITCKRDPDGDGWYKVSLLWTGLEYCSDSPEQAEKTAAITRVLLADACEEIVRQDLRSASGRCKLLAKGAKGEKRSVLLKTAELLADMASGKARR